MIRIVQAPPNQRRTAQLSRTFAAQYFIRVSFFTRAKVSLANFAFSETEVLCVCFASGSTFGNKRRRPGRFENVYLPTKRQEIMLEVGGGWNVRAGSRFEKKYFRLSLPKSPDNTAVSRRRPADVYIPAMAGAPVQSDGGALTWAHTARAAAAAYAVHKHRHLQTGAECHRQGATFMPMLAAA